MHPRDASPAQQGHRGLAPDLGQDRFLLDSDSGYCTISFRTSTPNFSNFISSATHSLLSS
jgi:hypothetical protein